MEGWYPAAMNRNDIGADRDDDTSATGGSAPEPGFTEPKADRPPTADEEAAAERGAADVDTDRVAEHYEEQAERGAAVRGEGEIVP
jgi:hypothetical protein